MYGRFARRIGVFQREQVVSATPPSIAIEALVLGGPEVVRVVLNSSSTATPPSIAIEALVLGGPEVMRVVLNSSSSSRRC